MPTYDYECTDCGHTFEYFQSMSDEPLQKCPSCGGKVKRLIGGGLGIIFKGSGFYVTDNRSKNAAAGQNGDKPKSDNASASKTGSDKKPVAAKGD